KPTIHQGVNDRQASAKPLCVGLRISWMLKMLIDKLYPSSSELLIFLVSSGTSPTEICCTAHCLHHGDQQIRSLAFNIKRGPKNQSRRLETDCDSNRSERGDVELRKIVTRIFNKPSKNRLHLVKIGGAAVRLFDRFHELHAPWDSIVDFHFLDHPY